MGTGSLKRIAALTSIATLAVLVAGAISAPAQLTLPGTTTTTPTVTVPTTTVRVPSTTVTTPTVKVTPPPAPVKAPAPKVTPKAPVVKAPVDTVKQTVPKVTKPIQQTTGKTTKGVTDTTSKVTGGGSSGGSSGSGSSGGGLVGGTVDSVAGGLTGTTKATGDTVRAIGSTGTALAGGGSAGAGGMLTGVGGYPNAAGGMTYLGGPGGPGGTSGGGLFGSGPGGGGPGAGSFGSGTLAAMLAGASALELRAVLQELEGCLPALPALDRRVITMRAGLGGSPRSRTQVASRLGMSRSDVRKTERRALNRLQFAAVNTGCAASFVGPFDPAGIGNLTQQVLFAGAVPVGAKDALTGDFAAARGVAAPSPSPLFELGGGGQGGPAWLIILFTVLLSVAIAGLTRELRHSF